MAGLTQLWNVNLGANISAQPVLASNVMVAGVPTDMLYVGTEHGFFAAINAATGALVWTKQLGAATTTCQDSPDGVFGITGTAAVDRTANRVYVADGGGRLWAFDLATGTVVSGWPLQLFSDTGQEHIYSALTLNPANGLLYAQTGNYCDNPPFAGELFAIGTQAASVTATFFPEGPLAPNTSGQGGGMWGMGGVSIDTATNNVFTAVGSALPPLGQASGSGTAGYADKLVSLTSGLGVIAANFPTVSGVNVDFGSTPMLYTPPGCPLQTIALNKSGSAVTYNANNLTAGITQNLLFGNPNIGGFDGVAAYSPVSNMVYVADAEDPLSGTLGHGLTALVAGAGCQLSPAWQQSAQQPAGPFPAGTPSVANGVVYYGTGPGNTLYAFNAATGSPLWNSGALGGNVYAAPVIDQRVYVSTWGVNNQSGFVYAFALPGNAVSSKVRRPLYRR